MRRSCRNFFKFSALFATFFVGGFAYADQAPNPRSAVANVSNARSGGRVVRRDVAENVVSRAVARRVTPTATARSASSNVVNTTSARSALRQNTVARSAT
ncbi:MAG: hypothetical protein IJ273_02595, partial [Alphaproteobacteria bacterium]|nr:hypothetical protein [Alphaproteobacteria bacterium]